MKKEKVILLISIILSISSLCIAGGKSHPNVVIIIIDDQGYGDLGITGNPNVNTPVLDKLANENIRFNNYLPFP